MSASCLSGIGFTMSLFLVNTAFTYTATIKIAKIGVLVASILAAGLGVYRIDKNKSDFESLTTIELPVDIQST